MRTGLINCLPPPFKIFGSATVSQVTTVEAVGNSGGFKGRGAAVAAAPTGLRLFFGESRFPYKTCKPILYVHLR